MKKKIGGIIYWLLIIVCLWISISVFTQAIKCPNMTQTELFLNIPNSMTLNWSECN